MAKNSGIRLTENIRADRVIITEKIVHASASNPDLFQVICFPERSIYGFVQRNATIAGMVNPSDPKNMKPP